MNDIARIFKILENSGFKPIGSGGGFIYLEDPSCILHSFDTFRGYAEIAVYFIAGILLFGWAISYIRGSKIGSLFANIRNMALIFGVLAASNLTVNLIWGGDVFARGCSQTKVSMSEIQRILDAR
ncbi:MAG: hypothetical protein LBD50_02335, partial [Rickettsiales bacterium]|nr:hypothetical protein [Rickettsiales bacterium]